MRLPLKEIGTAFRTICKRAEGSLGLVIVASGDCDSACAVHILKAMLKAQSIFYRIECVDNVLDLQEKIKLLQGRDCSSFFFINCASFKDLSTTWLGRPQSNVISYVIDSRRPINHSNVNSPSIIVIDDQSSGLDQCPTDQELRSFYQQNQEIESHQDRDPNQPCDDEEEDSLELIHRKKKRKSQAHSEETLQKIREKIERYYNGQHFAQASALMMYSMAKEVGKDSNDFLWSAVVGCTSQLIDRRVTRQMYDQMKDFLRSDVARFNEMQNDPREQLEGNFCETIEEDFLYLRHWSLYESMRHSTYLVRAFRLWTEDGRRDFNLTIAKMGYSQHQAKQQFQFMKDKQKAKLKGELRKLGEDRALYDLMYCSFTRKVDSHLFFSAADLAHSINTILEMQGKSEDSLEGRFWTAIQSLQKYQLTQHYIEEGKAYQQAIIRTAIQALQSKSIIRTAGFSYFLLKADSSQRKFFQHHQSQIRLARCIMDFYNAERKARDSKSRVGELPFVLGIEFEHRDITTVIGVVDANWIEGKNSFGNKFSQTAEQFKIEWNQHFFQASVIEIKRSSYKSFMSGLNL